MIDVLVPALAALVGSVVGIVGFHLWGRSRPAPPPTVPPTGGTDDPPLPVNPANPPDLFIYSPKSGRPPLRCSCHDRELVPGQRVIRWPRPDLAPGAEQLICEETVMKK